MKNAEIKNIAASSPAITMDYISGTYFILFNNGTKALEFKNDRDRMKIWKSLLKAGCSRDLNLTDEAVPATFTFQMITA